MPTNTVLPPYQAFSGADGKPLEGGYIYVGMPGFEARSTPKASFFDVALTIPTGTATGAAVRTMAGYPVRNGSAATIYVDGDYSITVTDKAGVVMFATLNRTFELGTPSLTLQPIVAPDGTLLQAGFGFASDTDTGLIRTAPNTIQVVAGGIAAMTITSTGVTGIGLPQRTIAQGTLSGSQLIVEIPSDIDRIELSYWAYLPSTNGQILLLTIGSGPIGTPVWGTNHVEQIISLTATTPSYVNATSGGSVSASLVQNNTQAAGHGNFRLSGFNSVGAVVGQSFRAGVNLTPAREISTGMIAEETPVSHTLIRLSVAAGTMAGTYRIEGYRKP